jgi:hypothetical protein
VQWDVFLVGAVSFLPIPGIGEMRRLRHWARWHRKDPVAQLAPGTTFDETYSVTTGLTSERSRSLAESLDLGIRAGYASVIQTELSTGLNQQFGMSLNITKQAQVTRQLRLTNESPNSYRLFALWHVERLIVVDLSPNGFPIPGGDQYLNAVGESRGRYEFTSEDSPFITYAVI